MTGICWSLTFTNVRTKWEIVEQELASLGQLNWIESCGNNNSCNFKSNRLVGHVSIIFDVKIACCVCLGDLLAESRCISSEFFFLLSVSCLPDWSDSFSFLNLEVYLLNVTLWFDLTYYDFLVSVFGCLYFIS